MKPSDCYRFASCNAPVCPPEPDMGHYLKGEAICLVARRIASGRGKEDELHAAVSAGVVRVRERFHDIAYELDRAPRHLASYREAMARRHQGTPGTSNPDGTPVPSAYKPDGEATDQ